jgi:hypothetical protein
VAAKNSEERALGITYVTCSQIRSTAHFSYGSPTIMYVCNTKGLLFGWTAHSSRRGFGFYSSLCRDVANRTKLLIAESILRCSDKNNIR